VGILFIWTIGENDNSLSDNGGNSPKKKQYFEQLDLPVERAYNKFGFGYYSTIFYKYSYNKKLC